MRKFLFLLCVLGVAACDPSYFVTPQTPRERLAVVEITFTKAVEFTANQYMLGNIDDETLQQTKVVARIGNDMLDAAHAAVSANDMEKFEVLIKEIQAIIIRLKFEVNKRKVSRHGDGFKYSFWRLVGYGSNTSNYGSCPGIFRPC